jgi:hypothetical protein
MFNFFPRELAASKYLFSPYASMNNLKGSVAHPSDGAPGKALVILSPDGQAHNIRC